MKSIYKKVKLSPFFLLLILLSLISGLFRDILCLFTIIVIHEIGHIIISLYFKWNIKCINITACGGYIIYDEIIDKPFKEELIISISGILIQTIFYVFFVILNKISILDVSTLAMIKKYHYSVLIFNLLPIFPLDGSKILNTYLNMHMSYLKSLKITNVISIIVLIIMFLGFIILGVKLEYGYLVIMSFVISKILKNINDSPFLFNRFLFERYKKPITKNKYFYINGDNLKKMRRQVKNYFYINGKYYKESLILSKRFD